MATMSETQEQRFYPARPHTAKPFKVGEVRYTYGGHRLIFLGFGWSDNGYGPIPFGLDAAVAFDCGWVWEPRVMSGKDLLSVEEWATYAVNLAVHLRSRAARKRREADRDDRAADVLVVKAEPHIGSPTDPPNNDPLWQG